jgi:hypothetical protein
MGRVIIVISIDDPQSTTTYQQTCQIHDDGAHSNCKANQHIQLADARFRRLKSQ